MKVTNGIVEHINVTPISQTQLYFILIHFETDCNVLCRSQIPFEFNNNQSNIQIQ